LSDTRNTKFSFFQAEPDLAIYSYIGYAPGAITVAGGTIRVTAGFDPDTDRVRITVDDAPGGSTLGGGASRPDDGTVFDGDRYDNEDGDDRSQDGVVESLDGSVEFDSGQIYIEEAYNLTAPGQPTVTLFRIEIQGSLVGYIPSEPLAIGVIYSRSTFNVTPTNAPDSADPTELADVPCFVAGTRIATPDGDRRVETLCRGDKVLSAQGGSATLVWTGQRTVMPGFLAEHRMWPIEIQAGALGCGLPRRALRVSPNHRMLIEGMLCEMLFGQAKVLVPAKFLLPLEGVCERRGDGPVSYCHLLFHKHLTVLAEGAASESLHPGDVALGAFHASARAELLTLFPELQDDGLDSYGPTAAPVLRKPEAAVLVDALRAAALSP
jgi:hypothetical protein